MSTAIKTYRTQYRVGHGGFHTTIVLSGHDSFVYVYDTGAMPRKALVHDAIDDFVSRLKKLGITTVDYLILSHIDEDHVNCFAELVSALDRAKITHPTVVLPWLEPEEKLLALRHANHRHDDAVAVTLAGEDDEVVAYFLDLAFRDIVYVIHPGSAEDIDVPDGARFVVAGTEFARNSSVPWTLIATRIKPDQNTLDDFYNRVVSRTGFDPDKSADRKELVKSWRGYIRSAMHTAANNSLISGYGHSLTNWSSLSIFGASASPTRRKCVLSAQPKGDLSSDCDHGWLHTGDLPLDVPDVWNAFVQAWQRHLPQTKTCALAAPHHGSPNGHNPHLFSRFSPEYVLYMTGWTAGSAKAGMPIYAKKVNPSTSMNDAKSAGATDIELNNP